MYDKKRINELAKEYVRTKKNSVFEKLLCGELAKVIDAQLTKNYDGVEERWEDLKQHLFLHLWENKNRILSTKSTNYYQYFYQRIRAVLNQEIKKKEEENE